MFKKPVLIHFMTALMLISTFGYMVSNSYENQLVSNVLSPIATLLSGLLISLTLKNSKIVGKSWFFLACMAFFGEYRTLYG